MKLQLKSSAGKDDELPVKRKHCSAECSTDDTNEEMQMTDTSKLLAAFQFS